MSDREVVEALESRLRFQGLDHFTLMTRSTMAFRRLVARLVAHAAGALASGHRGLGVLQLAQFVGRLV